MAAALASLTVLLLACGGDNESEPTPAGTATLAGSHPAEQALGRHIETEMNGQYAGDCGAAGAEAAGRICSVLRGERGRMRAYAIGPVLSEGTNWVFLSGQDQQWSVVLVRPITRANSTIPGVPWPLITGDEVVVAGAGDCRTVGEGLNVREGAGLGQRAVDCLSDGTRLTLGAGPTDADNTTWWQIEGRSGWISADFLRFPDAIQ